MENFRKWKLDGLENLSISNMNLSPHQFQLLSEMNLTSLVKLRFSEVPILAGAYAFLTKIDLPNLRVLELPSCLLGRLQPAHFDPLVLPKLEELVISNNYLETANIE